MKISEIVKNKMLLSFEVFPPKPTSDEKLIYEALDGLQSLDPDFISVTFGAGGGSNNAKSIEIASAVKNRYGIESVAHLPGIHLTEDDVLSILTRFRENNIENILALRGDPSPNIIPVGRFRHANELISFIKSHGDFDILAACYPEGHPESPSLQEDLINLKRKTEAGADHLVTQLFLDNTSFYSFREAAYKEGIRVPIEVGIMPVTVPTQMDRMIKLSGVKVPQRFIDTVLSYKDDMPAFREAGINYAIEQIRDLIQQGVSGVHLYTMNKPDIAAAIARSIR
jgi:methylenetetrahydrofolate reductase (NADPH)